MSSSLHLPIGDALKHWLAKHIKKYQPRLCSEFAGVNDATLLNEITNIIVGWRTDYLFIFISGEDMTPPLVIDKLDIRAVLVGHFSNGNTVTVVDPTDGSGCTIDWEGYAHEEVDSEVLIVTWGQKEAIAQGLVENLGTGEIFRGN